MNRWRIGMDEENEWMKSRNKRRIEINEERDGIEIRNEESETWKNRNEWRLQMKED